MLRGVQRRRPEMDEPARRRAALHGLLQAAGADGRQVPLRRLGDDDDAENATADDDARRACYYENGRVSPGDVPLASHAMPLLWFTFTLLLDLEGFGFQMRNNKIVAVLVCNGIMKHTIVC